MAKTLGAVLLVPTVNLAFTPAMAIGALLVARAKRSVRSGSGGHSAEAQADFRAAMSLVFGGAALLFCLFLTVTSAEMVRVWLGRSRSLGPATGAAALLTVLVLGWSLYRVGRRLGQGGALVEKGSPEAPLTGGLADDAHWVLGLWYVDRADPSLLVESRFGLGYTLNLGNRVALVFVAYLVAALVGTVTLTLWQLGLFG